MLRHISLFLFDFNLLSIIFVNKNKKEKHILANALI